MKKKGPVDKSNLSFTIILIHSFVHDSAIHFHSLSISTFPRFHFSTYYSSVLVVMWLPCLVSLVKRTNRLYLNKASIIYAMQRTSCERANERFRTLSRTHFPILLKLNLSFPIISLHMILKGSPVGFLLSRSMGSLIHWFCHQFQIWHNFHYTEYKRHTHEFEV